MQVGRTGRMVGTFVLSFALAATGFAALHPASSGKNMPVTLPAVPATAERVPGRWFGPDLHLQRMEDKEASRVNAEP